MNTERDLTILTTCIGMGAVADLAFNLATANTLNNDITGPLALNAKSLAMAINEMKRTFQPTEEELKVVENMLAEIQCRMGRQQMQIFTEYAEQYGYEYEPDLDA